MTEKILKPPVEVLYKEEIAALKKNDDGIKPENWILSPKAVRKFILGSLEPLTYRNKKIYINKKFFGNDSLVERCIITLAGNRGLMLVGEPGTAKTMLSELLSAAICGCSTNTVQGTAGTTEDMIKYSWNYAMLLAKGPTSEALVKAPLFVGMEKGIITRFEEITRCPSEIQDSLISILSDKVLNIPELGESEGLLFAKPGFNVIGTANTRDKGVNEMSSALKRRFNFETIFPIKDVSLEAKIIVNEVEKLKNQNNIKMEVDEDVVELLASTFHELREGISSNGIRIDKPSSVMSTAEAVSVYYQTMMTAYYYGDSKINLNSMAQNIMGAALKESRDDLEKIKSYFNVVVKSKAAEGGELWKSYYEARKWIK
ncbi:ATP-binding protein [Clostridium autoethanogenum]|uniref:AAA family ATPase n=2 Tax=Clostridium autoethanogenum TaxID=84023 RepID=A0A3M0SLL6_9CLOT|nr:AAA family ATPase [Clostridium autoethanogenum]AGY76940.1 AAA family ATPase [Clostridium autoethanogenum DSM 10061]ALU37084.1 ATPase associated with various cellular activities AAA_5 [Clostridium autoethanogenum DSM 10061]OVY48538.1 AAA domain (dynein-related subfamily) [Clostridium autoethanogenum]RMC99189.1 AAA family ATPase [Clostridium autoethanogenum]